MALVIIAPDGTYLMTNETIVFDTDELTSEEQDMLDSSPVAVYRGIKSGVVGRGAIWGDTAIEREWQRQS